MLQKLTQHRRFLLLLSILLLAASLRLFRLDLIDFRYDEAIAPLLGQRIAAGDLMSIAPFSGSVANHPPVYLYVLALPYLFTRDLMHIAAYRALLDVLAVGLFWWLCTRFYTSRTAWISTLLFTVAPWAIQFSRKLWLAPLPLFSVLLLWGLLEVVHKRNTKGWVIIGFGVALCVGTHLSAIYLLPAVILTVLVGFRTLRFKAVIIGIIPVLVILVSYLVHDGTVGYANTKALIGNGASVAAIDFSSIRMALWISGGAHLSDLTSNAFPVWQAQLPTLFDGIDVIQQVVLIAGLVQLIILSVIGIKQRNWQGASESGILVAFICLPVLFQLGHSRPLQVHYLAPIYPAPFLVIGLLADRLLSVHNKRLLGIRALTAALLLVIVVWQVLTTVRFTEFIARYDTSSGGYGLPIRSTLGVADYVENILCNPRNCSGADDVIVVTPGGDPLVNEQATIWHTVLADTPHRFADSNSGLILRSGDAIYIFTPDTAEAINKLVAIIPPTQMWSVSIPIRMGSKQHYTIVRTSGFDNRRFNTEISATWQSGVTMSGIKVTRDQALKLDILLNVTQLPKPARDYHWFNHVISGTEKVAQADGGGVHPSNWRVGDVLLHWFDITSPAVMDTGALSLLIGSYEYPSLLGIPVIQDDGTLTDSVRIPVK